MLLEYSLYNNNLLFVKVNFRRFLLFLKGDKVFDKAQRLQERVLIVFHLVLHISCFHLILNFKIIFVDLSFSKNFEFF